MNILSGAPSSSSTYSLFNSYSKLNENAIWSPPSPVFHQYIFLIQFLFKFDENALWSLPPLLNSSSAYSIFRVQFLFKIDENALWSLPLLLQCIFLIQFLFKIDENAHWNPPTPPPPPPPPPVHIPDSILQN